MGRREFLRRSGGEEQVLGGKRDRPHDGIAIDRHCDVHRPVDAWRFGELAGAVERVDDPHPMPIEAGPVVGALLGEQAVSGSLGGQAADDVLVGLSVAFILQGAAVGSSGRQAVTEADQEAAGLTGDVRSELVIGIGRGGRAHGPIPAARCSGHKPGRPRTSAGRDGAGLGELTCRGAREAPYSSGGPYGESAVT